jgi:hypothetical protein
MTAKGNTPPVSMRIPPELWKAAKLEADRRGEDRTKAVIRFLTRYAKGKP